MRRRTVASWILGIIAVLVLAAVATVLVLTRTDWGRERVRRMVVSELNKVAHGHVSIDRIEGNLLGGARLIGLTITDSAGHPFVAADTVDASYGLASLLHKHINLRNVRLVHPVIVLNRLPGGKWNYDRIFPRDTTQHAPSAPGFGSWITLTNVRVVDGRVTVRAPWAPADSLTQAQRDSVIRVALGPTGRQQIERVPGGFQRVSDFRDIYGTLPLLRLADPNDPRQLIDVASLRMTAEPFRPPDVRVTDARGRFIILHDSLYFNGVHAALTGSRLSGSGRYNIANNDLRLRLHADTVATNDLLWIDPTIPQNGHGKLDFALDWVGPVSDYQATNASLAVQGATLSGALGLREAGDTLVFHNTDMRFANLDTRTIAQLFPTLKSPEQGYLTGHAIVSGGFRAMQVNGDVAFADPRTGTSQLAANGVVGIAPGAFSAHDLHLQLHPVQVALARTFDRTLPVTGTLTGTATLNGSTASRLVARGDIEHHAATGLSHVIGTVAYAPGHPPLMNADVRLAPLSLATVGAFAPSAGLHGTVSGPVKVTGPMRNLSVNALLTTPDGGRIATRGTLDLVAPEKTYDLTTTATLFDIRAVTTRAPHTALSLDAAVNGRGFDLATMDATAWANVRASQYDSLRVDSAIVRVAAHSGLLTVDTLNLRLPGAVADAGGTFGLANGRSGTLRYTAAVDSLNRFARLLPTSDTGAVPPRPGILQRRLTRAQADSARVATATAVERAVTGKPLQKFPVDTPQAIPRSELAGSIRAAGTLTGNIHQFGSAGTASARDLVAYGNSATRLQATYDWTNALSPQSRVQAKLTGTGLVTSGFYLDSITASGNYQKPDGTVAFVINQDSGQVYAVNARFQLNAKQNTLFLDRMRLRFDSTVYASRRPSIMHWGPSGIDVDSLDLQNRIGRGIFVDGHIPTSGAADLTVAITQVDVANIVRLLQSDIPAKGLVSVVLHARGTREAPTFTGAYGLERFSYAGRPTPEVHGTFEYGAQTLATMLNAEREGHTPLLFGRGTVPINLALAGVTGSRIPRDRQIDATIRADSFPLDLLPQISTSVTDVGGLALAHVDVRGTVNNPAIKGVVAVRNGTLKVVPLGIAPTDIASTIRVTGDTVVIDSLVARSGGIVRLTGGIGLKSLADPRFDLHLDARNALVVDNNDYGHLRVDAALAVAGPLDTVDITGRTRVRSGVLYIPQSSGKTLVGAGDPALFAVLDTAVATQRSLFPPESPLLANLRMNVAVGVDRDVFVRSTEANVEVYSDGDLRVSVDRARNTLLVDGVLLSDRGEYQFQSRRFQILHGSATFINEPTLNPTLQATAQYQVQLPGREAFHIQIIISGTLDQPKIALQSDAQPPIPQTDLLSYLAFGRTTTSLLQQEGSTLTSGGTGGGSNLVGAGAAFAAKQVAGAALGALTTQVAGEAARSLGADVLTITPADISLDVSSFLRGMQVEFGKYVQTRTFLGINITPDPSGLQRPGLTLTHRFPGDAGYQLQASFAPRYLPRQPSLSPDQTPLTTSAFGLFLIREWRY